MKKYLFHFFRFFKILYIIIYYEIIRFLSLLGISIKHKPLVDFVMAGVQRGGTSGLYEYLSLHEKISLGRNYSDYTDEPYDDEVKFFDQEENFSISYTTTFATFYDKYHKDFFTKFIRKNTLVGANAPIYTFWENSIKRLWFYNKDIKIIVCLRNPITRAFSQWNKEVYYGREQKNFYECIIDENERCKSALPYQHRFQSYVQRGFYSEQIRKIWRYFDKKQVLFIKSENLKKNPQTEIDRVCDFLNIEKIKIEQNIIDGAVKYSRKISLEEKNFLMNVYEYDIKAVERLLNWDCSDWLK